MKSTLLLSLALALLAFAPKNGVAAIKQLNGDASTDDFVQALTPSSDNPSSADNPGADTPPSNNPNVKFRGIRVLNHAPTGADAQTPAVAVDIKFELNSATLSDDAKDVVKRIGMAMKSSQLSPYHFLVEGHTDTTGRADANLVLSARRAEAVRDYLIKTYGIEPDHLEAKGRGQEGLLDPNHPRSPLNRRVQIVNLGP